MSRTVAAVVALCAILAAVPIAALEAHGADCTQLCTPSQCATQKCDTNVPYACVGGPAKGGCSSSPSTFSNTTQCTACCDISSCAITCGTCDSSSCAADPCSAKAPFLCTQGQDKDGCAPTAATWSINPGCQACCNTNTCGSKAPVPPPTSPPLNCNASCGSLCHSLTRCPFSLPFMCTAGPEVNGCSSTGVWTEPGCTACCDVTTCPQVPCGSCPESVCQSTQCSLTNPYICTGGLLSGGCSPTSNYWPQSPDCTSCCNFDSCPTGGSSN